MESVYLLIRRIGYFDTPSREGILLEQLRYMGALDNETGEPIPNQLTMINIGESEALAIAPPPSVVKNKGALVWANRNIKRSQSFGIRVEVITESDLINQCNLYRERSPAIKGECINTYA